MDATYSHCNFCHARLGVLGNMDQIQDFSAESMLPFLELDLFYCNFAIHSLRMKLGYKNIIATTLKGISF